MSPQNIPDEFRIYCVVATTVQTPLELRAANQADGYFSLKRLQVTQSILQPPGRIAAQVGHVVSRMREFTLRQHLRFHSVPKNDPFWDEYCPEVTTIILGARDSFELHHVEQLLKSMGIPVHGFKDENKEYGFDTDGKPRKVLTAITTEPVHPNSIVGVLDYLPSWDVLK